ncbi:MAG: site-specific DNA-methyltransferase [Candidatus Lokiarchaeota archaeon]|nr:site-specific DNA-methyltransferase [Candidatus Lokiarchaeota archaeon]
MNENICLILKDQTVFFKSAEDMSELEDESIDVIITSPPYNRGKVYTSDNGEIHDDKMEESEYLSFLSKIWKECYRVAKRSAIFFLNIGDSALDQGKSEKVATSVEHAFWQRIQDIIWVKSFLGKGHYTPSGGDRRLNNLWEHVYLFVKDRNEYKLDPKAIGIPYTDKSNIGRYSDTDLRDPGNVWLIPYVKTTGATIKKGHEAPFPIGLPYKCIKLVPDVKTVLDPFGGTCSTLAACLKLGVKGYAYEKYPRVEVIKSRILEGEEFQETEENLIPHLELSLKLVNDLLSDSSIILPVIKSKAEYNNLNILNEVLNNLNIDNPFKRSLEKRILLFKESLNKKTEQEIKYRQTRLDSEL